MRIETINRRRLLNTNNEAVIEIIVSWNIVTL